MNNYANINTQPDIGRSNNRNSTNNFAFGRQLELGNNNKTNIEVLNDRDLFNKLSNTNETIDTSTFNLSDYWGMPIQGGSTTNNKKSLLSTPFMMESNNKNNWESSISTWDKNDMYAELESENKNFNSKYGNKIDKEENILEMAYNNNISGTIENNGLCKIENDVLGFEYELTKQKQKDIVIDVSSPFALGYVWKILILLTKNPSTDKLVKILGIKNKDCIITDLKSHADVFEDSGKLEIIIPRYSTQTSNTNYINKIEQTYKISIISDDTSYDNNAIFNLTYNFLLEIPFFYQPKIINDYLIGYNKAKTKFIELTDVPAFLIIDKTRGIVCIEIPCASNMILGFIYSTNKELLDKIPYDLITPIKTPDHLIKKLVIPKLNRNKKSSYSKNFKEVLSQVHLGEIIYGTSYKIDINIDMGLSISVSKEIPSNKYEIVNSFDNIIINHKCFYYVKNTNIKNKILSTGMIHY